MVAPPQTTRTHTHTHTHTDTHTHGGQIRITSLQLRNFRETKSSVCAQSAYTMRGIGQPYASKHTRTIRARLLLACAALLYELLYMLQGLECVGACVDALCHSMVHVHCCNVNANHASHAAAPYVIALHELLAAYGGWAVGACV
jgi:hypothetical protein